VGSALDNMTAETAHLMQQQVALTAMGLIRQGIENAGDNLHPMQHNEEGKPSDTTTEHYEITSGYGSAH